ncbi:MAG: hypothetical protein GY772_13675 [bacterium]|nr:hypothetical protein [bacterium]
MGKRILHVEGFATYRYVAGWCHEPDPADPLSVARHGGAMAQKDPLLPRLPLKPLKGVFAKTHLVTFLQLLQQGNHTWAGSDEPLVAQPASSQDSSASSQEELDDVLHQGIFMHVFPWTAVRDHRDDIIALMASDNFDHAFGLAESEVRCLLTVRSALSDLPVPCGRSQWDVVLEHVTRLSGQKWSEDDIGNFWNFVKTTASRQVDFIVAVWEFAQCESVLRVEPRFFSHLAKVPATLQWHRAALAVAHFMSDHATECTWCGGKYVAGAVGARQVKAARDTARERGEATERFLAEVMERYFYDRSSQDTSMKAVAAFAARAGKALARGTPLDTETCAKLEAKLRGGFPHALPKPVEPTCLRVPQKGPKASSQGIQLDMEPLLETTPEGGVVVSLKRRAAGEGFALGMAVCVREVGLEEPVHGTILDFSADKVSVACGAGKDLHVPLESLALAHTAKKKKAASSQAVPEGIKWQVSSLATSAEALRQLTSLSLYQLLLQHSAAHAEIRFVREASSQDDLSVVTAKETKAGALAFTPWSPKVEVATKRRPKGSVAVALVVVPEEGERTRAEFLLRPCPPTEASANPTVVPFWLLATESARRAGSPASSQVELVYKVAEVRIPTALPFRRIATGTKDKVYLEVPFLTNEADLDANTRLYAAAPPP